MKSQSIRRCVSYLFGIHPAVSLLCLSAAVEVKMYSSVKRLGRILVSISLIFIMLNICWPTWAQSAEPNSQKNRTVTATKHKTTNDSLSDVSANEIPKELKNETFTGKLFIYSG